MSARSSMLMRLGDSDHMLADPDQDIRGHTVLDCDGNELGTVGDLLIDPDQQKVRLLRVEHGGLFGVGVTPLFIPVETVESVAGNQVRIDRSRVDVATAPEYDPEIVDRDEQMAALYSHYGYAPSWMPGIIPPPRGFFR